ncbi:hybrid-cluster NAD(P)-dependent oxidoreductase [Leeia oryzae]|uniref:hybrid-cluster NAD(P)-dependent oxidoreductase n=1 Tax=Leeia oryzae TaxID=356662 RepID=UPI0003A7496F|nr:hybrid-cluster NAD(P)-dependent oxidoreductase [Leeia oryzae]
MNQLVNTHLAATGSTSVDPVSQAATWEMKATSSSHPGKRLLICRSVKAETHDVKTFTFSTIDYEKFYFEPGQFLTLELDMEGEKVSRCYTISSPPTKPHTIAITVKRVPGGRVSNWLHDHLQPNSLLTAFDPAGAFTPVGHRTAKMLFLSAGSGITPVMSMARTYADLGIHQDIVFVHNARSPDDIIFHQELTRLAGENPHFRLVTLCDNVSNNSAYQGLTGRLDAQVLQKNIPDFTEREVFVCGPAGYMDYVKKLLLEHGFPEAHYHQESFSLESAVPTEAAISGDICVVELIKSGRVIKVNQAENLMASLKAQGVPVPSSCGQGVCGTCKTRVVSGQVEMKHQGGIRQREIDKGYCLLCCSKPSGQLVQLEL